jgi:hypothetical protein
MDLAHGDSSWADIDRGIDEDNQIHRGNTFSQLRRELMAYNRASVVDGTHVLGRALAVGECAGGFWADPIIASQWIAIADDERLSGQGRPPQQTSGVIASRASFPHGRLSVRCCAPARPPNAAGSMLIVEQR